MNLFAGPIETFFDYLGHVLCRNRFKTLFISLICIIILSLFLPMLKVDTSWEGMLHKDDPYRVAYNQFRDQFGRDEIIIIAVESSNIFEENFLKKLKSLHETLESKVPYLEEVRSLVNARNTLGKDDTLYVDDLLKDWPDKKIDLKTLETQVMNNPVYLNNIISEDGNVTALIIETQAVISEDNNEDDILDDFEDTGTSTETLEKSNRTQHYFSEKENKEVVSAVENIIEQYTGDDFPISYTGGPIIELAMNRTVLEDLKLYIIITYITIIFFLYALFRRIAGIVLPLIVVFASLLCTMGILGASGVPITQMTAVLPSILSAVGTADAVHILAIFFRQFKKGTSKEEAISYSLSHSGPAVVMTSLTTAAGFMSFAFSELSTTSQMGLFAAIGVIIALIFTVVLLPALLAIIPLKHKPPGSQDKNIKRMDSFLIAHADFATNHPFKITIVSLMMLIVFTGCLFLLRFSIDVLEQLPEKKDAKKDAIFIAHALKGSLPIEVIIETGKENGIHDPDILKRIEHFSREIEKIHTPDIFVGKVFSITDIVKETNQALNGNDHAFYNIPEDKSMIAQELLLFENSGSDDLEKVVDSQFSKARITIKLPYVDIVDIYRFVTDINGRLEKQFSGKADFTITGMGSLMGRTLTASLHSMTRSYIIVFFVISIMMVVLVGSLKYGLVSMFPNVLPIIIVMGAMGALGLPLDLNALMMGSIAIGLVVDDTMHFMYNFRKYYNLTGNVQTSVRETLLGTGRAMLITTIVLSSSFYVIVCGQLRTTVIFGCATGTVIALALLSDFVFAPALMKIITRDK